MRCSEMVDTDFEKMIRYNLTDCVPGRGWGNWEERIEMTKLILGKDNVLVIHMQEALTVSGLVRVREFLAGTTGKEEGQDQEPGAGENSGAGMTTHVDRRDGGTPDNNESSDAAIDVLRSHLKKEINQNILDSLKLDETDGTSSPPPTPALDSDQNFKIPKQNVLGGGKMFLKFEDISAEVVDLANSYYAGQRDYLEQELARHGSKNGFAYRFGWSKNESGKKSHLSST